MSAARVTTYPPVGAGPFSVSVPVVVFPPTTLSGAKVRLTGTGAVTATGAVSVTPLRVAETVTVVFV